MRAQPPPGFEDAPSQRRQESCPVAAATGGLLRWQRPTPLMPSSAAAEWQWLPGVDACLVWDSTMAQDDRAAQRVVQGLVDKAVAAPLLPSQQASVLAHLDAHPALVHAIRLQPAQLPALVEHTPMLAYHVLLRLLNSRRVHAFLQALAGMQLSLHSMEVVNRLTTAAPLPGEFVACYISNCLTSCDGIQDKFLQNRLVRLVCVFLQSLIRSRMVSLAGVLHEVQAFCVRFSRIREAATLFRALKQMEAAGSTSGSPGGSPVPHAATLDPGSSAGSADAARV